MEKTTLKEPRCIICGQEKDGIPIKEDNVIHAIRWFNRKILKKERNFKLVVCKDCYIKYTKARKSYHKKQVAYLVIGVLFAAMLVAISGGNMSAVVYGLIIILVMYLLSLVSYTPALEIPNKEIEKQAIQQNQKAAMQDSEISGLEKEGKKKTSKSGKTKHKKVYKHE